MEVSALKYHGHAGTGLHGRSPLLRLQSDERLITLLRRGNTAAFEVLVSRYESRLLAFCRHLLGSREDAEDVLQEVMTAAFNAIVADERPINVRPWLYRIARNRSLNHLRRTQAIAVDTMDFQLSEHGATTADKVHEREAFRLLVGDIHELPETQKTALVLREMDAMSYEQIAEAMETTVSSVKSLLVRARLSLAEAAEARALSCEEVRIELAEIAEGLLKRPSPLVKRHLKGCDRCTSFRAQLKHTNKALAALLPVGPLVVAKKFAFIHFGHSATAAGGSTAAAGGVTAAGGAGAGALAGAGAFSGGSGFIGAGIGAVATKAVAGLAAAALVTAGAVEVNNSGATHHHHAQPTSSAVAQVTPPAAASSSAATPPAAPTVPYSESPSTVVPAHQGHSSTAATAKLDGKAKLTATTTASTTTAPTTSTATGPTATIPVTPVSTTLGDTTTGTTTAPGRTVTQTSPSVPATTTSTTAPPPVILPPTTTTPPTITTVTAPTTTAPQPTTTVVTVPTTTTTTVVTTTTTAPPPTPPTTTPADTDQTSSVPADTQPPAFLTGTITSPPTTTADPISR
jgi:RNA polymerase sigma factor (sigma-70 family)